MGKYVTIQLPAEFIEEVIDPLVNTAKFGFSSRAEVVKAGVRKLFSKLLGWKPPNESPSSDSG